MNFRRLAPPVWIVLVGLVFVPILFFALRPAQALTIKLGQPSDQTLFRGFFQPEISDDGTPFRWSSPGSHLPATGTGPGAAIVALRANGDLRNAIDDRQLWFERDRQPLVSFEVFTGWRVYQIILPAGAEGFDLVANGHFRENRNLGVPVAWLRITPVAADAARSAFLWQRAALLALGLAALALTLWMLDHWLLPRSIRLRSVRVGILSLLLGLGVAWLVRYDPFTVARYVPNTLLLLLSLLVLGSALLVRWLRYVPHQASATVPRTVYPGIFFVALATLIFQILLSRIFSVTMFYHFAFVAISIAMFGMTVGAGLVYLFPQWFSPRNTLKIVSWISLTFSITIIVSFLTFLSIPLSLEVYQQRSFVDYFAIALAYVVISVPFVFSGIATTLTLTRFTNVVSQVYAADLAGAALGCVLVIVSLNFVDGPTAVLLAAACASLGALFFALAAGLVYVRHFALLLTLLVSGFALFNTIAAPVGQPGPLRLVWTRGERDGGALYEQWNHFSRVRVYGNPDSLSGPFSWGLSPNFPADRTFRQVYLQIDSEAGAALAGYHGDLRDIDYLRYDVTNLAHYIRHDADVLVIGIGGGRDIISALAFDQQSVTGIEINGEIVDAINGPFGDLTGYLYRDPRVHFVIDEARSYIVRNPTQYDILQISMIDTWAATTAGAYTFTENSLYTTRAWAIFLDRLKPGGILSVSRWYFADRPGEVYRLASLATATLRDRGISDPRSHMMIIRKFDIYGIGPDGVGTLLLSNEPFAPEDVATIEAKAAEMGFEVVLSPLSTTNETFVEIVTTPDLARFTRDYPINIAPPTDNNPFFFHMLRFGDIFDRDQQQFGEVSYNMRAVAILGFLLALVTTLTFVFVILPLLFTTRRDTLRGAGAPLLYFAGIGMGFMLVEISQMQRLVIFLGHPTY
ncbi:MAG: hypothetical protein EI684_00375, partial [Candidatus Viridilinea halotolerans]